MTRHLKIWQKMALVGALFITVIVALLGLLVRAKNKDIDFAKQEKAGVAYVKPLRKVIDLTSQRAIAISSQSSDVASMSARIDEAFAELKQADKLLGNDLGTTESAGTLETKWHDLKAKNNLKPEDSTTPMQKLLAALTRSSRSPVTIPT